MWQPRCTFPSVNQVFSQSMNIVFLRPWFECILCVLEGFVSRCPVTLVAQAHPGHEGRGGGQGAGCSAALQAHAVLEVFLLELRSAQLSFPLVWTNALQVGCRLGFFFLFLGRASNRLDVLKMPNWLGWDRA